jgi:hypothetical protein
MAEEPSSWHLDKRVPISLIVMVLINLGTVVWFAAKFDSRIGALETEQLKHETQDDRERIERKDFDKLLLEQISDLNKKVDRLIERE